MNRKVMMFILCVILISSVGYAYQGNGIESRKSIYRQRIVEVLGLTENEIAKFSKIQDKYRKSIKDKHTVLKKKRKQLMSMLSSGNIDEAEAKFIIDDMVNLQEELLILKVKRAKDIYALLGKDRYKKLQEIRQGMFRKRNRRNGKQTRQNINKRLGDPLL